MTNTNPAALLQYIPVVRPLAVGMLAVFETYNRKKIGCSIVKIWEPGEISSSGQIKVRVIGDQGCYHHGMELVVEADAVAEV